MKDNMTWKLKGCPRCSGDILIGEDGEGWKLESCLQCGYRKPLEPLREVEPIEIPDNLPPLPGIPNGGAMSGLARGNIIRPYLEKNSDLIKLHCLQMGSIKVKQLLQVGNNIWYDWAGRNLTKEKVDDWVKEE